ncbi:MAG: prepilin-type N-terminal cleavage/methylation domain-containing protein [Magnetococcales bacterium]|nr:prepilin-type N-terminal cleavage/methylation domain-containing protein [Magnetococcales bacterium]
MRSRSGMTLIELVVVMVVVGILAVYAGAKWQGDLTLYTKADQLLNDIRRAQALAMSKEAGYTIQTVAVDSYRIVDATGTVVDPQPTVLTDVTITPFAITFNTRGDPGGASVDITLTMAGQSVIDRVVGNTGAALRLP